MNQKSITFVVGVFLSVLMALPGQAKIRLSDAPDYSYPHRIAKNSSLYQELRTLQLEANDIFALVKAAKPYTNLNRVKPGTQFRVGHALSPKLAIGVVEFKFTETDYLYLEKEDSGEWKALSYELETTKKLADFQGVVQDSLWISAQAAEMDSSIIAQLAEIFAWQIDFSREVRKGDTWRLTVEQEFVGDKFVGWGRVTAAEYINSGRSFQAVYWNKEGGSEGYFAPDGSSLEKLFLKSPIEFGRISSKFNLKRFHPILKRRRPHRGVDYAARRGTPIRSIGDGRITYSRYTRGGGNTLAVTHNSIYKTKYMHLQKFAKGIREGVKVKQGQIIGYVGTTGLSTGPHLHFEFYKRGTFVDPLKVEFPSAKSVPQIELAEFTEAATQGLTRLPDYIPNDQHVVKARGLASDSSRAGLLGEERSSHQ